MRDDGKAGEKKKNLDDNLVVSSTPVIKALSTCSFVESPVLFEANLASSLAGTVPLMSVFFSSSPFLAQCMLSGDQRVTSV